jgi:NitT/TauT family transport system ATP-binding protein
MNIYNDSTAVAGAGIVIDGISQVFRGRGSETRALEGVGLSIEPGEFVAVVGPSGCGKSTLLRIVSGLIRPTAGRVVIGGTEVTRPYTDLGIVFQSAVLLDWRNVLDNVLLQVEMRSLPRAKYVDRALALLKQVGLADFHDRLPHQLSGGMQQRTSIARALVHDPSMLLMDEPFGALDALTREQMRLDLESIWLDGRKTVLFITHSIDEAVLLADRVVVMSPRPGRIERVIDIRLPRPRGLGARRTAEFDRAVDEITGIFMERGVLHSDAPSGTQKD